MKCPSCDEGMEPAAGATFSCGNCGYSWPVPPAHREALRGPEPRVGEHRSCSVMPGAPRQPVTVVSSFRTVTRPAARFVVEDAKGRLYIVAPSALDNGRRLP